MVSGSDEPLSDVVAAAIFDSSPDAIIIVDQGGMVVRANRQAEYLFGYPANELEKLSVEDLIPQQLREIHKHYRQEYQADPKPRAMGLGVRIVALKANGNEIAVDASLAPMSTPRGVFTIVTLRRRAYRGETGIPQLFRVISGKNPFQAWLMGFMLLASFPLLFNAPPPASVQAVVPHWTVLLWASTMSLASSANIFAVYWRKKVEISIWVELASCVVLAMSNLLYPAAILTFTTSHPRPGVNPSSIWFTIILLLAFSVCSVGRAYQLQHDRNEVSEVKKLLRAAGVAK